MLVYRFEFIYGFDILFIDAWEWQKDNVDETLLEMLNCLIDQVQCGIAVPRFTVFEDVWLLAHTQ